MCGSGRILPGVTGNRKSSKADLFFVQKISAADIERQPNKHRKQIFQRAPQAGVNKNHKVQLNQ